MTTVQLFQVDAFTSEVFHGNPAAVCPLEGWLEDGEMQAIAEENNLAETAFFVPEGDRYGLRWFTPRTEVDLCGHATLASAFVIFSVLHPSAAGVRFETRSGELVVSRDGDLLVMDFPALPPSRCENPPEGLVEGVGATPSEILSAGHNYVLVFEEEDTVRGLRPDLNRLEGLGWHGIVVTAPGREADFVSRYFAPAFGIPEDPVTGSTHCTLVPYWAGRMGKSRLYARQVSARQGELWCEDRADRVSLAGHAALYLQGTISL